MTRFSWKPKFVGFDITLTSTLPWQPDVTFSKTFSFYWKIHRKSILAIICHNFTFSVVFLVNNGHRAIKVNVSKAQYCRAGHIIMKEKRQKVERNSQHLPSAPLK